MKKVILIPAALILLVFSAYKIAATKWNVKPEGVAIAFTLPGDGTKGTVSGLNASIDFNEKDPASSVITATIETKTINTGNDMRDKHLRTADFFDVEKYPNITFKSSKITAAAEGFVAEGTLTVKDSTKNVAIPFTFENKGAEGVFKGKLSIFAGDYGVMKKSKSGKDQVDITIEVPVVK